MTAGLFLDQPGPIESVFLVAGAASVCIWWWFSERFPRRYQNPQLHKTLPSTTQRN
jgi:hypothetical protein